MSWADSSIVSSETSRFLTRSWRSSSLFWRRRFRIFSLSFLTLFAGTAAVLGDIFSNSPGSLLIRDAVKRCDRPVNLFCQHQSCQLVGQGHPGEREDSTRPRTEIRIEAVRAADREDDRRRGRVQPGPELAG